MRIYVAQHVADVTPREIRHWSDGHSSWCRRKSMQNYGVFMRDIIIHPTRFSNSQRRRKMFNLL